MNNISKFLLASCIAAPFAAPQLIQAQNISNTSTLVADAGVTESSTSQSDDMNVTRTQVRSATPAAVNQAHANDPQGGGSITIKGSTTSYASLEAALDAASDGSVLEVSGNVIIDKPVEIKKSVTLIAAATGGSLSTCKDSRTATQSKNPVALYLHVNSGKTLTLGDGNKEHELLFDEVNLKITNGKLVFKDGVKISSTLSSKDTGKVAIVEISGKDANASFEGGTIENPVKDYGTDNNNVAVTVENGAQVEKISGGNYMSWGSAWTVGGKDTKIKEISGGTFLNSQNSGLSVPCFFLMYGASIDKISGGDFRAYSRGALELQSDAHVGEISGGTFKNLYDTNKKPSDGSGAKPFYAGLVLYGREGKSITSVDKISGGTFVGVNGVLAVGNTPQLKVKIGSITGGTFSSIDTQDGNAGLYFTQNSEVDEISGNVVATGRNIGLWNAGTIQKILSGSFTGKEVDGLQNVDLSETGQSWATNFKGHITEIAGGTFKGKKRGLVNAGVIDTISNGTFEGGNSAVLCDKKTKKGTLSTIKNGTFYAETDTCIKLVSKLTLEPDLATTSPLIGAGRYYAPQGKAIFNDEKLVTYPQYTKLDQSKASYTMSDFAEGLTNIPNYDKKAFRFLKGEKPGTVTFMDGETRCTSVKVHLGKAIATDELTDQSMPANPQKDGYTFKEWNTKKDGTGTAFKGDTVVHEDMTVYAIYTKNTPAPSPTPEPTPLPEPTPKPAPESTPSPEVPAEPVEPEAVIPADEHSQSSQTSSVLPKTDDPLVSTGLYSTLGLVGVALGALQNRLRRLRIK